MTQAVSFDSDAARRNIQVLSEAAPRTGDRYRQQLETFIRVGEYGLALDSVAYAYLNTGTSMPAELFKVFNRLASCMGLYDDPEYEGVAELRRVQAATGTQGR